MSYYFGGSKECNMVGHGGIHKTLINIRQIFLLHMELDVKGCIQSCLTCQQVKARHGQPNGLLQLTLVPTHGFHSGFACNHGGNPVSKQAHTSKTTSRNTLSCQIILQQCI